MIEDENDDDSQELEEPGDSTAIAVATCQTAITKLQNFHHDPVALPAHQAAQLETIDDESQCLEMGEVPEKLRDDPEFAKFFTTSSIVFPDPYDPKKQIEVADWCLEFPSKQLTADYAENGIIRLCQKNGISPAETADVVRFWHQLRIQAARVAAFQDSHPHPSKEKYQPSLDESLDEEIAIGTPTREDLAAKIEAILRDAAPAEVATTLVFTPPRDRLGALTKLRQVLGVNIARWFQLGIDNPEYAMALQDGRVITIGSSAVCGR